MNRFFDFLYSASVRQWAIILAGIPLMGNLVWVIYLIRNGWPQNKEVMEKQLVALSWIAYLLILNIVIIIVSLTATKFKASGLGGSVDIDGSSANSLVPNTSVTETTSKTVEKKDVDTK